MTYDAANLIGYMLGAPYDLLVKGLRNNTKYCYSRCSANERRKYVRGLCRVRAALIDSFDDIQFMLEAVRKGDHPEEHMFAKQRLLKLPTLSGNPTKRLALKVIQDEIWSRVSEEWFAILCGEVELDTKAARDLFWFDVEAEPSAICRALREQRDSVDAPVYASKMAYNMLHNDKQLHCLIGQEIPVQGVPANHAVPESHPDWGAVKKQVEALETLHRFCESHSRIVVEVDAENIEATVGMPVIEYVRRYTTVQVFVHTSNEVSKGWHEQCLLNMLSGFTRVQARKLSSGTKNQVDVSVMTHAIKEHVSNPETGIVVLSSDSDFIMLPRNICASDVCVCCRKGLTSQRYIAELKEIGASAVVISADMLEAEEKLQMHLQREYFLGMFNKLLPNLRECYDSVCMTSQKPAFEDLKWSITPEGKIQAN